MRKILFSLLIFAILISGCASESDKEWEYSVYEHTITLTNVMELLGENQTDAALTLCNGISYDYAKNSCYYVYIVVQNVTNRSIPDYICDEIKLDVELPPKKILEGVWEEKIDYEEVKEEATQNAKTSKQMCYELTKEQ